MVNHSDEQDMITTETKKAAPNMATWHLNALTEALGNLTLTVSDSLSIGRGSDNDVVLGSKQVSRNHALLSVLNGKLYIKDLDSSNGSFINEERIEGNKSKLLNADDTVGFASFVFQVMSPMGADSIETPLTIAPIDSETSRLTSEMTENTNPSMDAPIELVLEEATVVENDIPDNSILENTAAEPVVKSTIIEEVLSAAATDSAPIVSPAPNTIATPEETVAQETVISTEPLITDSATTESATTETPVKETLTKEPVMSEPNTNTHHEPTPAPESEALAHDKTTKTALQEEADPDVLRAKQAATSQLSGTANLGQARDLGTESNNAVTQALDNPATTGHAEKKPSGGWFIWVFVAMIIIGLALWLFNMGSV